MDIKLEALRRFVTDKAVDVFSFTEANTCWDVLPESLRLARCTRGWWGNCQWTLTHNRTESQWNEESAFQPGGTGILCLNQVAHKTL